VRHLRFADSRSGLERRAGEYRGPEALVRFVQASRERTDTGEHIEVVDLLEGADHAAAYHRVTAERAGKAPLASRIGRTKRCDAAGGTSEDVSKEAITGAAQAPGRQGHDGAGSAGTFGPASLTAWA
jgi:hypothetical protein